MKIIVFLLTTAILQVSASTYGQNVTIRHNNADLAKVIRELRKQTGYDFVYSDKMMESAKPVSINLNNVPFEQALEQCFENQPLTFSISDKIVTVKEKEEPSFLERLADRWAGIDVNGRVVDEQGQSLVGATIIIKRTGKGTQADQNGSFKLSNLEAGDVLTVSYVGYIPQSVNIGDKTSFLVALKLATNELDRVVIQAYGTTTQRFATGNIAKVTAKEIEKQPVMNPLLALQGRVPGLVITQLNGYASAPISITLRGKNQLELPTGGSVISDPLYIVDGVPLTVGGSVTGPGNSSSFLVGGFSGPANGQSPLFSIDPASIESIEVLKDADATSIYGSRGANGVILITTKKGKVGKMQVNASVNHGVTKATRLVKLLNTQQYLEMRREAINNDGFSDYITQYPSYFPDLTIWDTTRYTNWQKEFFGGTGLSTDARLSASGGSSESQVHFGASYGRSTDVLTVKGANQRASVQMNINQSFSTRFNLNLAVNYSFAKVDLINLNSQIALLAPNAPALYTPEGKLNWDGWSPLESRYPLGKVYQPYESSTGYLTSSLVFNYHIDKGFNFTTNLGYTDSSIDQMQLYPEFSQNPQSNLGSFSEFGKNRIKSWIVEPQLEFSSVVASGKLSVLTGLSIQKNTTNGNFITALGFSNDALMRSLTAASTIRINSDNFSQYSYAAIFGRVNYNLLNKYIVNISARRDGSSRFGEDHRFGNFMSVGAVWIFTEENWLKNNFSFLSFGKIRGSYGSTGSDQVGDYAYLSQWKGTTAYSGDPALNPLNLVNPDYHWQSNKKLEAGVDLGFWKDKILLNVAWYRNRCSDQLVFEPVPATAGFFGVFNNSVASVQNTGLEVRLNAKVIEKKNFSWNLNFNTSRNSNKLLAYPNLEQSIYANNYIIGEPLNITRLLRYTGVDPQTGLYTFEDKNNDGVISTSPGEADDRYIYTSFPYFTGGFGNNLRWKSIELSAFFNIVKQKAPNAFAATSTNAGANEMINMPLDVLKRWRKPGDVTSMAKYSSNKDETYNNFGQSDGVFTDAAFIRLSNLSLSFDFNEKLVKKMRLQGLQIYAHSQNIFTISAYKGGDPESQNIGGLPPLKTVVCGVRLTF